MTIGIFETDSVGVCLTCDWIVKGAELLINIVVDTFKKHSRHLKVKRVESAMVSPLICMLRLNEKHYERQGQFAYSCTWNWLVHRPFTVQVHTIAEKISTNGNQMIEVIDDKISDLFIYLLILQEYWIIYLHILMQHTT